MTEQEAREIAEEIVYSWTISTRQNGDLVERITLALLEARKKGLDEAAKEVCSGCRYDLPIERIDHLDVHIFKESNKRACQARAIRELEE